MATKDWAGKPVMRPRWCVGSGVRTRLELRLAIVSWIEGTYHRKRRQRGLGRMTPIEFEMVMLDKVALAA